MTELDKRAAFNALKIYAASILPESDDDKMPRPSWLDTPAEPVAAHMVCGRCCWEFALKQPQNGVTGYVLDVVGNVAYEIHGGHVARALWLVGLEPGHGVAVPWRERKVK